MKKTASVLGVLPLVLFSASAWSGASADLMVDNFRIELVDLDPNDGITPALVFDRASGITYATRSNNQFDGGTEPSPFGTFSSHLSDATGTAESDQLVGDVLGAGATFSASSAAYTAPGQVATALTSTYFDGASTSSFGFTLTPETEIRVLGNVSAHASADNGDTSQAQFGFGIGSDNPNDPVSPNNYVNFNLIAGAVPQQAAQQQIDASLANTSSQSLHGEMGMPLTTRADSYSPVVPVPEPNAALLPLLGFGWLVRQAWRRKAARA